MNISDFKHLAPPPEDKNSTKSLDIKEKSAFSFVEIILVMVLISFLYVVTSKVIQHNLEKKIPVYVYYLYKNLENENTLLTKKLLKKSNEEEPNSNKSIGEVLKGLDAKSYCQTFAEDTNLIGQVDCINSSTEERIGESNYQIINFNCTRDESIGFGYANNTYQINSTSSQNYDSTKEQCIQNKIVDKNQIITCNAKPPEKVNDLLIDNTQSNYTYSCQKIEGVISSGPIVSNYDVDKKIDIPGHLKTTNNIHLFFKTLYAKEITKGQYNLNVKLNRDEICPRLNTLSSTLTADDTECEITCTAKINNTTIDNKQFNIKTCSKSPSISGSTLTCSPTVTAWVWKTKGSRWIDALTNIQEKAFKSKIASVTATTSMTNNCDGYLQYAQNVINGIYNNSSAVSYNVDAAYGGSCSDHSSDICSPKTRNVNMDLTAKIIISNTTKELYTKYFNTWNNFFNDYSLLFPTKQSINAISNIEYQEGAISGTENLSGDDGKQYLAHFIYAAIDTPFDKGEMDKNIFTFEQFGNRIIPVGYLANNANTPLKFDVITRNPQSLKINKVNEKPLTFCEAMSYTSETFSEYCGCKDESNKVITKYMSSNSQCNNNFGCKIRPIKPSLGGRF